MFFQFSVLSCQLSVFLFSLELPVFLLAALAADPLVLGLGVLFFVGDEVFFDGFPDQEGWKEALAEDEVVKALLVEARAQGGFGVFAEGNESGVAVEIAVGLAGHLEGVALYLRLGHGVREDDFAHEEGFGFGWGDFAGL